MFAYDKKPTYKLSTGSDIARYGRQSLLRALSIGRVIAFTGSGTSYVFGQPTWSKMKQHATELFFFLDNSIIASKFWKKNKGFTREFKTKLSHIVHEIEELANHSESETPEFLELCETYFKEVEPLLKKYGVSSKDLSKGAKRAYRLDKKRGLFECQKKNHPPSNYNPKLYGDASGKNARENSLPLSVVPKKKSKRCPPATVLEFRAHFTKIFYSSDAASEKQKNGKNLRTGEINRGDIYHQLGDLTKKAKLKKKSKVTKSQLYSAAQSLPKAEKDIQALDSCRALHAKLGISRFMTLNYDLELERMLLEETRSAPGAQHERFIEFLDDPSTFQNFDTSEKESGRGRSVTLSSGSGRILRSTSSRKETLADLFAFGAFPTNYNASVHHLHGRIDDPKNMIITPKDYQRIYYANSDQQRSFDEARHAVFTGSDILFIGMGHKEHDVLKPLRNFLELQTDKRESYGKVYYFTAANLAEPKKCEKYSLSEVAWKSRQKCLQLTQMLHQTHGLLTLYSDFSLENFEAWHEHQASIFQARAELDYYCREAKLSIRRTKKKFEVELWNEKHFKKLFGKNMALSENMPGQVELKFARAIVVFLNSLNTKDKTVTSRANKLLNTIKNRLHNRALVEGVNAFYDEKSDWWENWSKWPGLRWAIFGEHRYEVQKGKNTKHVRIAKNREKFTAEEPLVWRQTNMDVHFIGNKAELTGKGACSQLSHFIDLTNQAAKKAIARTPKFKKAASGASASQFVKITNPAAVARISMAPGAGKGRLMNFLVEKRQLADKNGKYLDVRFGKVKSTDIVNAYPFQLLFRREGESDKFSKTNTINYIGCFAAHLTFSLEFSSLIFGLCRFLQTLLDDFIDTSKLTDDQKKEFKLLRDHQYHNNQPDRVMGLELLDRIFNLLASTRPAGGWKTRSVILFSYLDRLVDEQGDGYSPTHRHFFRLLNGKHDPDRYAKLPLDFVFINCDATKPIRYLSQERLLQHKAESKLSLRVDDDWHIRRDRNIALRHWKELRKVDPFSIFDEALNNIARQRRKSKKSAAKAVKSIYQHLDVDIKNKQFDFSRNELRSFAKRRVLYGYCIAALIFELWLHEKKKTRKKTKVAKNLRASWSRVSIDLSNAIASGKTVGFFTELIRIYRRLDRKYTGKYKKKSQKSMAQRNREEIDSQNCERLASIVVSHLALFDFPISAAVLKACPEIRAMEKHFHTSKKSPHNDVDAKIDEILHGLAERGLVSKYWKYSFLNRRESFTKSGEERRNLDNFVFALDPQVSSAIRSEMRISIFGFSNVVPFQVSLYPSQAINSVKPDIAHYYMVCDIVRELVRETHAQMVNYNQYKKTDIRNFKGNKGKLKGYITELQTMSEKLRSAYALIRGTFSISVISRLNGEDDAFEVSQPFDEYRGWTRELLNSSILLAELVEQVRGKFSAKKIAQTGADPVLPVNQPFFRDEVTWLFNERAMVSFIQGRLFDAQPLFDRAREVTSGAHRADEPVSYRAAQRRIILNQGLVSLERGHIRVGQLQFEELVRQTSPRWSSDTPSTVHCYAKGYLALCHHLCDNVDDASKGYRAVIEELGNMGQLRGQSIFLRHHADLLRAKSKSRDDNHYLEAIDALNSSEQIAQSIRAVDLQNYALISRARLQRDMKLRSEALENLRNAEKYSKSMGNQKLLCEVLKVRGEVLLADGEATQAGFVTAQSVAMAKRNGMRLRKISAVIIQAQIMIMRGQRNDAARLLQEVLLEAQTFGYAVKAGAATQLLSALK